MYYYIYMKKEILLFVISILFSIINIICSAILLKYKEKSDSLKNDGGYYVLFIGLIFKFITWIVIIIYTIIKQNNNLLHLLLFCFIFTIIYVTPFILYLLVFDNKISIGVNIVFETILIFSIIELLLSLFILFMFYYIKKDIFNIFSKNILSLIKYKSIRLVIISILILLTIVCIFTTITYIIFNIYERINNIKKERIENITSFIKKLFIFLKSYDMCFLSGTIIFEDTDNRLFNILTYNKDTSENIHDNNILPGIHWTTTHLDVYNKQNVLPDDSIETSSIKQIYGNKKFKLELILNEPIDYLCDLETDDKDKKIDNISQKRVLLYYRFIHENKKYIFFKLEEYNMNSIHHLINLLDKKRKDIYNKRRENEDKYETEEQTNCVKIDNKLCPVINNNSCTLNNLDKIFYNRLACDNIIKNINDTNFYDKNLRTGRELFVTNELKTYLLNKYYKN